MSGDVVFSADVEFQPPVGNPGPSDNHRKAVLMLRQSLDADSPYLDVSTHGDGMTALQFRVTPAGESFEIRVSQAGPKRLRIEKHGDEATVFIADKAGDSFRFTGAGHTLKLTGDFYVGLGVCLHNDANLESVVFSYVEMKAGPFTATPKIYYTIETQSAASTPATDRYALYTSTDQLESPLWLPDSAIAFISDGRLMRIPASPTPAKNATGETLAGSPRPTIGPPVQLYAPRASDSTISTPIGLSPGGKNIVFSMVVLSAITGNMTLPSEMYALPLNGGTATQLAEGAGCSLSPDGKTAVYLDPYSRICTATVGETNSEKIVVGQASANAFQVDPPRHNPAFSSDGKIIYYSERTISPILSTYQIWRVNADGSEPVQLTNDDSNNYFSSASPTAPGVILFTTWPKDVKGQPDHTPILVRRRNADGTIDTLARITGGPGTAPSWSQDGKYRAFVSQHRVYGD
jgi:hypothetical protein